MTQALPAPSYRLRMGGGEAAAGGIPVHRYVADLFDARCKIGTAPDASRKCGSQPADQSLLTDVHQASPPPMRKYLAITARGERRKCRALGLENGHQSGGLATPVVRPAFPRCCA